MHAHLLRRRCDPTTVRHVVVDAGRQGPPRGADPRSTHGPLIHDCAITAALRADPRPAGHLLDGGGDRRATSFPYRWNPAHQARVGLLPREGEARRHHLVRRRSLLRLPRRQRLRRAGRQGDPRRRRARPRCSPTARRGRIRSATRVRALDDRSGRRGRSTRGVDRRRRRRNSRGPTSGCSASPIAMPMRWRCRAGTAFLGATRLFKHDLETGTRQVHDFGPGRHPGEFVFVPAQRTRPRTRAG